MRRTRLGSSFSAVAGSVSVIISSDSSKSSSPLASIRDKKSSSFSTKGLLSALMAAAGEEEMHRSNAKIAYQLKTLFISSCALSAFVAISVQ